MTFLDSAKLVKSRIEHTAGINEMNLYNQEELEQMLCWSLLSSSLA